MNIKGASATLAIGAVVCVALLLGGWFLLIGPTTTKLAETQEERANLVEFNEMSELNLIQLRAAEKNLDATRASESDLNVVFPDTAEQLRFFEELTDVARAAGIDPKDITSLSPTAPTPAIEGSAGNPQEMRELAAQAEIAPQAVTMSVTASNAAVRRLLQGLENMDRAFFITSLSVSGTDGEASTSITGATFVAPPLLDPDERAAAADAEESTEGTDDADAGDSGS